MLLDGTTYEGGALDHHKEMTNPQPPNHSGDHHRRTLTQDFEQERPGRENSTNEGCDHVEVGVEGAIRGDLGGDGGGSPACVRDGAHEVALLHGVVATSDSDYVRAEG